MKLHQNLYDPRIIFAIYQNHLYMQREYNSGVSITTIRLMHVYLKLIFRTIIMLKATMKLKMFETFILLY